jgi:hypothetical protein
VLLFLLKQVDAVAALPLSPEIRTSRALLEQLRKPLERDTPARMQSLATFCNTGVHSPTGGGTAAVQAES